MAATESLIFDLLVRDRASDGISKIGTSAGSAAGSVDSLVNRLNDVGRKSVTARLALSGDKEAQASLDKIDARLLGLDRRTASPNITVEGAARAAAEVSALDIELDKLGKKGGSADVATSAVGSEGLGGSGGMIALVGAGVAVAPVIATVAVGLGGLAAAAYGAVTPILAAGTATAAAQQALAGLDPAQRAAYTSLGALKTQFGGFSKALQPEVLGIFNQGLKLAGGLLGDAEPVAAATGKALGGVVGEIGADLRTQQWQNFFGFMARTAGPDVQLLGTLFTSLMNALPPLLEDLQPVSAGLITFASGAAEAAGDAGLLAGALPGLRDKLNDALAPVEKSIPKGSENIFQVISDGVGWISAHVPDGNKSLLQLVNSTGGAAAATKAMGDKAAAAAPQVGTLSGDLGVLSGNTTVATDATKAWNDMWSIFVGKSVSDQQAVLAMSGAFDTYNTTLKTNKQNSTVAQQAFLSIVTTMGSGLSTLEANGASVRDLNSFYADNISKLKALHGLTPAERADVQGITRDYDVWANSTAGLSKQTVTAAGALKTQFLSQIGTIEAHAPGVSGDVTNLATSILKTGNNSAATRADRQKLIDDLEAAGVHADNARALVNKLQGQIDAMHGKNVTVGVAAKGSGNLIATENILGEKSRTLGNLTFVARGGRMPGFGGGDILPAMLEPGEAVVDKHRTQRYAPVLKAMGVPGFSAGGVVGQQIPDWMGGMGSTFVKGAANAGTGPLLSAFLGAAAKASAAEAAPGVGAGVARWTPVVDQALSMLGLSLGLAGKVLFQMQTESGGNPLAINLTDVNALLGTPSKGLMQVIGPTFAEYHVPGTSGNVYDPLANVAAAINYADHVYGPTLMSGGTGIGSGHGYDNGGYLPPGLSLAYNGTGVPEPVIPAGRIGGDVHYHVTVNVPPTVNPREAGRQVADLLLAHTGSGGRLYPAGTAPR
jgi:SLT domain-containing protein